MVHWFIDLVAYLVPLKPVGRSPIEYTCRDFANNLGSACSRREHAPLAAEAGILTFHPIRFRRAKSQVDARRPPLKIAAMITNDSRSILTRRAATEVVPKAVEPGKLSFYVHIVCASLCCLQLAGNCRGQELQVAPDNLQTTYLPNQTIRWNVQAKGTNIAEASYTLKKGGLTEFVKGRVALSEGKGQIETKLDEPGWVLAEVTLKTANGKSYKELGGGLVSPEKIPPALSRPADFDSFWEAKLTELAKVPVNAQVDSVDIGNAKVDYFKINMDNIRGTRIRGQLARPKAGGKLPAMLIVQWAGVYPLQKSWVEGRASEGWLVLNISAHDLPIDEPESYYRDQSAGPLKDYTALGNDDRETSYFLRMYLSCYRAAQYLTERSDWDGHTLVVTGGSQGGLQSIVTAALHPRITAVLACVPAGCDLSGPKAGRLPGWPMWYWQTKDKDEAKVRETGRYFDVVNFASRVKCPVLIGAGLIDTTCPPPGVFAAFNQLQGPKEIVVLPVAGHGEKDGSHRPYYRRFDLWDRALVKGQPAPVNAAE
jgi:cephalosporin-C deacetylase